MAFVIGGGIGSPIHESVKALAASSDTLSLAVSYMQVSGWQLLREALSPPQLQSLRIVCDDKMGITNPEAVRRAQATGARVRAFSEEKIFHPKLYLGHRNGAPDRFLICSANLSSPALLQSVESGMAGEDLTGELSAWFEELFDNRSAEFDAARLTNLEAAFARRVKADLSARQGVPKRAGAQPDAADLALIDELFAELGPYVAPLSFNLGKNNVRSLEKAIEVVRHGPRNQYDEGELRFYGLTTSGRINGLGAALAAAPDIRAAAWLWVPWLRDTPDNAQPYRLYKNLAVAKRAYARFWEMQPKVRDYFLANAELSPPPRPDVLQAIELLANAGKVAHSLSLDEIKALAPLLTDPASFPPAARATVRKYIDNNGTRSWGLPERRHLLEAWQDAP